MRKGLNLAHCKIPGFDGQPSNSNAVHAKMQEWSKSDFAGFSRILQAGSDCAPDLAAIRRFAEAHRAGAGGEKIRDFVILGIGGSSLGGEAVVRALHPTLAEPRFHVMDNSDPDWFRWLLDNVHPEETLFYVVAKSGGTPETISQFLVAVDWVKARVKGEGWKKHFVLCTDPVKGDLRELANRWKLSCLDLPAAVGGRFSVLTPVGLFPAAFAGLKLEDFLAGAASVASGEPATSALQLAHALVLGEKERPITVVMPYSTRLSAFSRWFCQLWGESLGKEGRGFTPFPAVGATDQHSQMQLYMGGPRDKCMLFVRVKQTAEKMPVNVPSDVQDLSSFALLKGRSVGGLIEAECLATRDAVTEAGIANCTIELDKLDAYSLGALFYFCENLTALAGALMGVNPFDQPGVEAAKVLTKKYLSEGK